MSHNATALAGCLAPMAPSFTEKNCRWLSFVRAPGTKPKRDQKDVKMPVFSYLQVFFSHDLSSDKIQQQKSLHDTESREK